MNLHSTASEGLNIKDKAAFEMLFRSNYSKLCSYADTFLKDLDAAEEIVQEVMFKVWVNRKSLEITTSIQSFLFRSVRNGCLNMLKHAKVQEDYKVWNKTLGPGSEHFIEDGIIVSELEMKIRETIDRLPMERRKVFILSRYEGMTYAEIASKLGISVKTVENQMGKALKFLRKELAEYLPLLFMIYFEIFRN